MPLAKLVLRMRGSVGHRGTPLEDEQGHEDVVKLLATARACSCADLDCSSTVSFSQPYTKMIRCNISEGAKIP